MRSLSLVVVAAWLSLASGVSADDSSPPSQSPAGEAQPAVVQPTEAQPTDGQPADPQPTEAQATDTPPPVGPSLQPSDSAPVVCDPASAGFHYLEVRGSGFDAWATQRLVGNVVDARGVPQVQWGSVWVSPQGRLTLEVNLCADPFRNRAALPAGDYTVSVGAGAGAAIAATSIALSPPPDAPAPGDEPAAEGMPPAGASANRAAPTPTPLPLIPPNAVIPPTPTPLPTLALPASLNPTPTPAPRTGPGSLGQPYPPGAPGLLADGWQLVVQGVTADAYSGIKAAVPSTQAPAPDQRDFMVRVQATYLGQSTGVFSAMRLALVGAPSQTTYDQLHNGCGIVPDMVPSNLVTSGGSVRGNACFAVRVSDLDSLILFDNQSADNDRQYFSVK